MNKETRLSRLFARITVADSIMGLVVTSTVAVLGQAACAAPPEDKVARAESKIDAVECGEYGGTWSNGSCTLNGGTQGVVNVSAGDDEPVLDPVWTGPLPGQDDPPSDDGSSGGDPGGGTGGDPTGGYSVDDTDTDRCDDSGLWPNVQEGELCGKRGIIGHAHCYIRNSECRSDARSCLEDTASNDAATRWDERAADCSGRGGLGIEAIGPGAYVGQVCCNR